MKPAALLVALAAGGAPGAGAQNIMSASIMSDLADDGSLSGSVVMKMTEVEGKNAASYQANAASVADAMGCGEPEPLFSNPTAEHARAGFDKWFSASCTPDGRVHNVADATTRAETKDAGAYVVRAFDTLAVSPRASSEYAKVSDLSAGLVVQFEGFKDEVAAKRAAAAAATREAAGRRALSEVVPDDTMYAQQTNYPIMNVEDAWAAFPAAGNPDIVVQVVDTGLWVTHEEFQDNLWHNPGETCGDGVDNDDNGLVDDCYGYNFADGTGGDQLYGGHWHGTHCAGTIAGTRNNGKGIAGICGGDGTGNACKLMIATCFGNTNTGGFAEAIVYGADHGAHISSNSWGYTSPEVFGQAELDAIDYATDKGVLVVFAAGNDDSNEHYYPGYHETSIAVAAVDDAGKAASFTNYGDWIEISAPGVNVLSTWSDGDDAYSGASGTSFSCPTIAGLLGLCLAANPIIGRDNALDCLYSNSFDLDDDGNSYNNGAKYLDGLGVGMPNAETFLACCANGAPSSSPTVSHAPTTAAPSHAPTVSHAPTPFGCGLCDVAATLAVYPDGYYAETTWELAMLDPTGCRHDASSNGGDFPGTQWAYVDFATLCNGKEYTLTVHDSFGDGMCCAYGEGEFYFEIAGERVWEVSGEDASFGSMIAKTFTVPAVGGGGGGDEPTAEPTSMECVDDPLWHKKSKTSQDCDYIEDKNEKKKWKEKKVKMNCKKKSEDKVKAKDACECACHEDRIKKKDDNDEATVVIVVPVCVAAVLLIGVAAYLVRGRTVKGEQHRRVSMPWFTGGHQTPKREAAVDESVAVAST